MSIVSYENKLIQTHSYRFVAKLKTQVSMSFANELAKLALPPPIIRVKLWVQDPLGMCVTYQ